MVGGGLMRGIKIPLQDFALKIQGGGLCVRGGAYLRDTMVSTWTVSSHFTLYGHTNHKLAAYVFNLPKLLELRINFSSVLCDNIQ